MTKGQIIYFYTAATDSWAKYTSTAVDYVRQGDRCAYDMMINSVIVNRLLRAIRCYDPSAENLCFPWEDALAAMNTIMTMLGLCGELENLPELTSCCCNGLQNVQLLNA